MRFVRKDEGAHSSGGGELERAGGPAFGPLARRAAAALFASPDPVEAEDLAAALECDEADTRTALDEIARHFSEGSTGIVLRAVAGGYTFASDPEADATVRRLLAKPRTPPLSQAQAECLAIAAYLKRVSRPEIARIRGVNSDSPIATLEERGLIEEAGRSRFGAVLYRTTPLFEKLFGLESLADLPELTEFDATAEEEQDLRDKLLRAGEQRVS
jgi:segregation and condensation protein B